MNPGLNGLSYANYDTMSAIGVFCHEWGHALGLPDLYDTDYSGSGLGNWCMMATGCWGGDGYTPYRPVHMSAWAKMELGWLNPTAVRRRNPYGLWPVEFVSNGCWLISRNRTFKEYFLVENRQRQLFDENLPGYGLLIYHIDDSVISARRRQNQVNAGDTGTGYTGWRYGVALEQADGLDELYYREDERGDGDDPWPGGLGRTVFDSTSTTPNSRTNYPWWATLVSGCLAKNIPPIPTVTCTLSSGVTGAFVGGPDENGYLWIDSDTTGGPSYAWTDISTTGTLLGYGNEARWSFTLPYNFPFYGTNYTSVWVSTNGWLSFGADPDTNAPANLSVPTSEAPNRAVFVFWDDLNLVSGDSGGIYYQNFDTSPNRYTIIMWKNARHGTIAPLPRPWPPANKVTFQAILYEDGRILLQYRDCAFGDSSYNWGRSATVGIENAAGNVGLQYLYNGAPLGNLLSGGWPTTRAISLERLPVDVGCTRLISPAGIVDSGTVVTPACSVFNYGRIPQTYGVRMRIGAGYVDTADVVAHPAGTYQYVAFPSWTATQPGDYDVSCITLLAGDLRPANDVQYDTCTVIGVPPWPWYPRSPIPTGARAVKDGGWLAYDPGAYDGTGRIYASRGYKQPDFFAYAPVGDSWKALAPWPLGIEGKLPSKGSVGCADGNGIIYATKGNNKQGFWAYYANGDSWSQKKDVPLGLSNKKVKGGTDMVFVKGTGHDTGYVYLLKGYKNEFYRYDTEGDSWHVLAPAPGAIVKWDKGSWLVAKKAPGPPPKPYTIYAHKAKYHEFYSYNTETDSWNPTALLGMPITGSAGSKKSKDGGCAALLDDYIYAFKGGNTQEFWQYTVATNSWAEKETIPRVAPGETKKKKVKAGADVVTVGMSLYAIKGNKSNSLWQYVPGAFLLEMPEREGVMAAGAFDMRNSSFVIAPDPLANGFATLRYSLPHAGPAQVRVYDVTGRTVMNWTLAAARAGATTLDLRHLSNGVYLVKFSSEGFAGTQKLVVQR